MKDGKDNDPIKLTVVTPEGTRFEGYVSKVNLPTHDGYIGFLPGHFPLVCVVGTGELAYVQGGETRYMSVSGGFCEVQPTEIRVMADVAEMATDIDVARAEAALRRAEERLRERRNRRDQARANARLQRALSRLRVARKVGQ